MLLGDSQEPSGVLVHLDSGQKPPFCPMMHQAIRANYPPKGPGRVLPEIKFGGVNVGRINSVQDSAGRVLPLSDIGPSTTLQAPTSSCPGSLERVLPRRGLELPPTDTVASRFRRAHRPRRPRADPPPPSLEFAATGVCRAIGGFSKAHNLRKQMTTRGISRFPPIRCHDASYCSRYGKNRRNDYSWEPL